MFVFDALCSKRVGDCWFIPPRGLLSGVLSAAISNPTFSLCQKSSAETSENCLRYDVAKKRRRKLGFNGDFVGSAIVGGDDVETWLQREGQSVVVPAEHLATAGVDDVKMSGVSLDDEARK